MHEVGDDVQLFLLSENSIRSIDTDFTDKDSYGEYWWASTEFLARPFIDETAPTGELRLRRKRGDKAAKAAAAAKPDSGRGDGNDNSKAMALQDTDRPGDGGEILQPDRRRSRRV